MFTPKAWKTMRVGKYLFKKLKAEGVTHAFGIPGDFTLPLFKAMEDAKLQIVVTTHEPSAGFAADAYARLRGLGAAVVTYGAGALNMVNATAQAYAEKSPVLVISGAPEVQGRKVDTLIHHKVKTFDSQLNVYNEITGSAVALKDPTTAAEDIDRIFDTVLKKKRPGYIEVPRDLVDADAGQRARKTPVPPKMDHAALDEAMKDVIQRLNRSLRPVIYAGLEIMRFNLREKLIHLVEKLGLPIATSIEGKAVIPEDHPNFVGIYMGQIGSEQARKFVEDSDCLLMLGGFLTDVNTGQFTARVNRSTLISASSERIIISNHRYSDVTLLNLIDFLLESKEVEPRKFHKPRLPEAPRPPSSGRLRMIDIVEVLNSFITPARFVVTSDVGDCLYCAIELCTEDFLGPGYYNSMGFGVPAAIAAQLAAPERRAIALVGDGGFQMTGVELSTAKRLSLNPIVIVCNNGSYATMQAIAGKKSYFDVAPWDYVELAKALGGTGTRVDSRKKFREALERADASPNFFLIETIIDPKDISPTWQKYAEKVKSRIDRSTKLSSRPAERPAH